MDGKGCLWGVELLNVILRDVALLLLSMNGLKKQCNTSRCRVAPPQYEWV